MDNHATDEDRRSMEFDSKFMKAGTELIPLRGRKEKMLPGDDNGVSFNVDRVFPIHKSLPSVVDLIFFILFIIATMGFFACAVFATDIVDSPGCKDLDWDTAIAPYLDANNLNYRDCTELVHVLGCEYMLQFDPGKVDDGLGNEYVQTGLALTQRQILNFCGGSCQVCGITWLAKTDMAVGKWTLYICSVVATFLGAAWSRVYLSSRNRGDVLQVCLNILDFEEQSN